MNPRRRTSAVIAASAVAVAGAAAAAAIRHPADDCRIVGDLVARWQSTVAQSRARLDEHFGAAEVLLAATEAEDAVAAEIRARIPRVASAGIAADLSLWAEGIGRMARSQRAEVTRAGPDREGPPPADYIRGALDTDRAGLALLTACPAALGGPGPTRS